MLMGDDGSSSRSVVVDSIVSGNTRTLAQNFIQPNRWPEIKPGHGMYGFARGVINGSFECKYQGCIYTSNSQQGRHNHEKSKMIESSAVSNLPSGFSSQLLTGTSK